MTTSARLVAAHPVKPMNAWRLERLRLTRSPRALALAGVYLLFGLLGPVMAKYMQDIIDRLGSGVQVVAPDPTPKDGLTNYISQVSQTGLVVVVVIAAGALNFDSRRGISTFLRTRVDDVWHLVAPRFTINAAAAVGAYTLGTLAAWYETALLLGSPPARVVIGGLICGSIYLVFAVAVTAASASIARSTLGTVGFALAMLAVLPILGLAAPLHPWLPSTLVSAPIALFGTSTMADFASAITVSLGATIGLLALATSRLRRREI